MKVLYILFCLKIMYNHALINIPIKDFRLVWHLEYDIWSTCALIKHLNCYNHKYNITRDLIEICLGNKDFFAAPAQKFNLFSLKNCCEINGFTDNCKNIFTSISQLFDMYIDIKHFSNTPQTLQIPIKTNAISIDYEFTCQYYLFYIILNFSEPTPKFIALQKFEKGSLVAFRNINQSPNTVHNTILNITQLLNYSLVQKVRITFYWDVPPNNFSVFDAKFVGRPYANCNMSDNNATEKFVNISSEPLIMASISLDLVTPLSATTTGVTTMQNFVLNDTTLVESFHSTKSLILPNINSDVLQEVSKADFLSTNFYNNVLTTVSEPSVSSPPVFIPLPFFPVTLQPTSLVSQTIANEIQSTKLLNSSETSTIPFHPVINTDGSYFPPTQKTVNRMPIGVSSTQNTLNINCSHLTLLCNQTSANINSFANTKNQVEKFIFNSATLDTPPITNDSLINACLDLKTADLNSLPQYANLTQDIQKLRAICNSPYYSFLVDSNDDDYDATNHQHDFGFRGRRNSVWPIIIISVLTLSALIGLFLLFLRRFFFRAHEWYPDQRYYGHQQTSIYQKFPPTPGANSPALVRPEAHPSTSELAFPSRESLISPTAGYKNFRQFFAIPESYI